MGRRLQISLLIGIMFMIVGAVALVLWDQSYEDRIAEGVSIGGVDVGGMEPGEAERQIRASLITPLDRKVVVRFGDKKYTLEPEEIDVRADLDGMVDQALAASTEGDIFARSWRRFTGGEVDHDVEPRIAYSQRSVGEFVDGLAAKLERDPVDASVEPNATTIEPVPSKNGRSVDTKRLLDDVEATLQEPDDRRVSLEVEKVRPKVTTEELAAEYPAYLVVDRANFKIRFYRNLELDSEYTIALGKLGHDTPAGLYHIQNKAVDPVWNVPNSDWAGSLAGTTVPPGPSNPLKARWMGIYDGVGIHGTADEGSLGTAASHGCIRMAVVDVVELYDKVPTGTPIYIS